MCSSSASTATITPHQTQLCITLAPKAPNTPCLPVGRPIEPRPGSPRAVKSVSAGLAAHPSTLAASRWSSSWVHTSGGLYQRAYETGAGTMVHSSEYLITQHCNDQLTTECSQNVGVPCSGGCSPMVRWSQTQSVCCIMKCASVPLADLPTWYASSHERCQPSISTSSSPCSAVTCFDNSHPTKPAAQGLSRLSGATEQGLLAAGGHTTSSA
jgi:hypothetical protein